MKTVDGKIAVLAGAVALLASSFAEEDNVGGGALEKNAAVSVPSGFSVRESFVRGARSFDRGWEFSLGDRKFNFTKVGLGPNENGIGALLAEKKGWSPVDIPHDWMITLPVAQDGRNGFRAIGRNYPRNSVGWYRKRFSVPESPSVRPRVWVQFDGIYRDARVWMNGVLLGRNDSGYIGCRFEVTDLIEYGGAQNSLVVRVDASVTEGWWYEGAGIYRHVKLIVKGEDHIKLDSILFRTLDVAEGKAVVSAEAEVEGAGKVVFELDGVPFEKTLTVENPMLWSPDAPNLQTLVARLVDAEGLVKDEVALEVGIRRIVFDAKQGLLVNGVRTKVKGVCCHADMGCVGVAVPDALHDYRVKLLKKMGVNANRTCHNPPSPEFLDACDRQGVLVMDETRMFSSSDEGLSQFRRFLLRDRNHACVAAFSIGNEEHNVQNRDLGARMALRMKSLSQALAPDVAVTYGGNNGKTDTGINSVVDVRGVNYVRIGASVKDGRSFDAPDRYHAMHPGQPMWGTEEASALSTRESREDWGMDAVQLMKDGDIPENNVRFPWAATAEQWWNYAVARDWFAGSMVWTGFDYRGESRWPATVNNFGIMDICGFPKASYWYYKANWTDEDVLHAWPNWMPSITNIWVDSNCEEIELSVNGRVIGRQKGDRLRHLSFPVRYEPGEAVLSGSRGGRKVIFRMTTPGPVARLVATADRTELAADGEDATVINIQALDGSGNEVFDSNGLVVFSCEGPGKIVGVGNGDPLSHEDESGTATYKITHGGGADGGVSKVPVIEWRRRLFHGKCQIVVRSSESPGVFRVAATSTEGCDPAIVELKMIKDGCDCSKNARKTMRHRSDYRGIEVGAITYSWWKWNEAEKRPIYAGADTVIANAKAAGLGTVELMGEDAEASLGIGNSRPQTPEEHRAALRERLAIPDEKWIALREKFAANGLAIHLVKFGWIGDKNASDAENDYFCKVAKLLGAMAITREVPIGTGERFGPTELPGVKLDLETARRCAAVADRNGVVIAFHNHMQINMLTYDSPLLGLSPNLMINFDIGHFVASNETDAMEFVRKYKDRIISIHIKDRTTPMRGSASVPWGMGNTPLVPLFRYMRAQNWFPHCDIELEYDVPEGSSVTDEIGVCNRYCRDKI